MKHAEKYLSGFLSLIFFLFCGISAAKAQTVQQVARKAFGSTCLLVMEDANGQPLSLGSGFFIRDGEIASNLHVIEGAASGYARLVGQETKYDIQGISGADPKRDLVILKVMASSDTILPLGDSDTVQVGESVYAVGNPQGLEGTFSQGIVSSIRGIGSDRILQITAPISPGSSGGPVLNTQGEVIGVSVATFTGGQNLNFAIPAKYLKTLLGKSGSVKLLSQAKPAENNWSILSDLGGRSLDSVVGSHFNWSDNQFMGEYTFSVRNKLRESVEDVICLVIFYGHDGLPIHTEMTLIEGPIGGRLAKRSAKLGRLSADEVRNITSETEIRILDFRLLE